MSFTVDDVYFLASPEGRAAAGHVADLEFSRARYVASTATVRAAYPAHHTQLVELVLARSKATAKLRAPADWLLTQQSVEQATPYPVAERRAKRIAATRPGAPVHDLTCSVGAELAELVRAGITTIGSDVDAARTIMASHNVPAAYVLRADALRPVSHGAVLIADPARRDGAGRIHDPTRLMPPLPELLEVVRGQPYAIKCAPGVDFATLDHGGEVEVTSLDAHAREACLWSADLAGGVRRRAVVMHSARGAQPGWTEEITDAAADRADGWGEADGGADGSLDRYIIEPDSAIVRAGLVRHWAVRHGLRQLDPRIAHLTGNEIPAGYSGFPVLEVQRLDIKVLKKRLRDLDCGSVEILVRGVDQDPDVLRTKLGLRGSRPLALVVSRVGSRAVAVICDARRHHQRPQQPGG